MSWSEIFQSQASVYALDDVSKKWIDRGTTGLLTMYHSNTIYGDVRIKWQKRKRERWWKVLPAPLKSKGDRAWVLQSLASVHKKQEIIAIRFIDIASAQLFHNQYYEIFGNAAQLQQQSLVQKQTQYPIRPPPIYKPSQLQSRQSMNVSIEGNETHGKWECSVCTYLNANDLNACHMCLLSKDASMMVRDELRSQSQHSSVDSVNLPSMSPVSSNNSCVVITPISTSPLPISSINPWMCNLCTYTNPSLMNACAVCGGKKSVYGQPMVSFPSMFYVFNVHLFFMCIIVEKDMRPLTFRSTSDGSSNTTSPMFNSNHKQRIPIALQNTEWKCSMCTLANNPKTVRCEGCGTSRNTLSMDMSTNSPHTRNHSTFGMPHTPLPMNNINSMHMQFTNVYNNLMQQTMGNQPQLLLQQQKEMQERARKMVSSQIEMNRRQTLNNNVKQNFQRAASDIACYNDCPHIVFVTLRSVARKLLKNDPRYRILDTTNAKVVARLIGFEGVLEFLMLLGFEADSMGMKLICKQTPSSNVIQCAMEVLNSYENKLNIGGGHSFTPKLNESLFHVNGNTEGNDEGYVHNSVTAGGVVLPNDTTTTADVNAEDTLTLEQIIIWSTHESMRDSETMETLIINHKTITDSLMLMRQLRRRFFNIPIPMEFRNNVSKVKEYRKTVQKCIQLKVIKSVRDWLKHYWMEDFADDEAVQNELHAFINEMEQHSSNIDTPWITSLAAVVAKEFERYLEKGVSALNLDAETMFDRVIIPSKFNINNLSAEDYADQITHMDYRIFCKIRPREFLGQAWKKKNNKKKAPNILSLIQQFNDLTTFVQIQILRERSLNERGKAIKRAVKMGERFRELKNYNSLCAVYSALNSAAIHRLKLAWKRLPQKHCFLFEQFQVIFSRDFNHRNLRQLFRSCTPPSIPHIGLFLQDLVFIDDGNSKLVEIANFRSHGSMINFSKCVRVSDRIKNIRLYQMNAYDKLKQNFVAQKILKLEFAKLSEVTEDLIWEMSYVLRFMYLLCIFFKLYIFIELRFESKMKGMLKRGYFDRCNVLYSIYC